MLGILSGMGCLTYLPEKKIEPRMDADEEYRGVFDRMNRINRIRRTECS
jgi:hypothetical protein